MADPVISLARGVPSSDLIPAADLATAAAQALAGDASTLLSYGDPQGYAPLRAWIGARLGADPARILMTNGSLPGLALVAEHLYAGAGGHVVVEAPTYDRTILILRRFGATVHGIPLEADGLDVDALERALRRGLRPSLVYTIPCYQNPAGANLSREKRERLVALAREHGFLIYEDDPYRELRYAGDAEPTLLSLDGGEHVIHATSFTKTIAPGVRTGALVLPRRLVPGLVRLADETWIGPTGLAHGTVAAYCASGAYERNLARVVPLLAARRDAIVDAVDRHLGERAERVVPGGGYFLWLRLPGVDADALADRAEAAGVPCIRGSAFFPDAGGREHLRLAFSAVPPALLEEGVRRLAGLVGR